MPFNPMPPFLSSPDAIKARQPSLIFMDSFPKQKHQQNLKMKVHQHGLRTLLRRLATAVGAGAVLLLTGCASPGPVDDPGAQAAARDRGVQLQIFLDSQNFGPGAVDGRSGEFTSKALAFYRQARGLPLNVTPDVAHIRPYARYAVTPEDMGSIGQMAVEPADQAQQKRLPYTTALELLAERFHTTQAFLRELNPTVTFDTLQPGTELRVPNVGRPLHTEHFPSGYRKAAASAVAARQVIVDTRERMLQVREGEQLVAAFPITPGSAEHPAPPGEWKIARSVPWPWYRYDEGVLKRGERTENFFNLPPGPNSPVGLLWAGLNRPGVGIHGTSSPETIGRSGSHGCIRLANWDAATFYTLVDAGVPVTIR